MARPLRIEFRNALYHVSGRGYPRKTIFKDDADRARFLELLGEVVEVFNWRCHAYCLMGNQYHIVIATPDANLSKGMRQLNGIYTQWINRRHRRTGNVFRGRFKSILIDANNYLLEVAREVVLAPVRAELAKRPGDWKWSSYRATTGQVKAPQWLDTKGLLAQFGTRRSRAIAAYERFVKAGIDADSPWQHINRQAFLGDDKFVARMQKRALGRSDDRNVPKAQRRVPPPSLKKIAARYRDRDAAMRAAWATGEYSYAQIAAHFDVHFTTVGRIVRQGR